MARATARSRRAADFNAETLDPMYPLADLAQRGYRAAAAASRRPTPARR